MASLRRQIRGNRLHLLERHPRTAGVHDRRVAVDRERSRIRGVDVVALAVTLACREDGWHGGEIILRLCRMPAITAPREMAEKHFLDSLVLLPALAGRRTLLDVLVRQSVETTGGGARRGDGTGLTTGNRDG